MWLLPLATCCSWHTWRQQAERSGMKQDPHTSRFGFKWFGVEICCREEGEAGQVEKRDKENPGAGGSVDFITGHLKRNDKQRDSAVRLMTHGHSSSIRAPHTICTT